MSFRHPMLLVCLEVIPLAMLAWVWLRSGRATVLPFDHGIQARGRVPATFINMANCLPAIVLAIVIAILCGPLRLSEPKTKRRLTNIQFCVDISYSMDRKFGEGNRYDASMAAIDEFLDYRQGDAFGLTFFGNNVLHWVPLTTDASAVRCSTPFMRPAMVPVWYNGTAIGKALRACRKVLTEREEGDRMVVLVSDGDSSDLSNGKDEEIARDLVANNIVVYTIYIGGGAAPDPVVNITSMTGGELFMPGDVDALKAVFAHIDQMEAAKLDKISAESMDDFAPLSIASLSILGLGLLCLFGLRYTPW
jgi:Ca-activated chloride channel family protein